MIVSTNGGISDIQLTGPTFEAVQRWVNTDTSCGKLLHRLAVVNDGQAVVVSGLASCTGFSEMYLYDTLAHSAVPGIPVPRSVLAASLDGSRVYLGGEVPNPQYTLDVFDSSTHAVTDGAVSTDVAAVAVSGNASRVIVQNDRVYSKSLSLTGNLPSGGIAFASRDSSKAFVYRDDGGQPRVVVHDLNGALPASGIYPTLTTVNLTSSPGITGDSLYEITMASTPDDAVVFVSGSNGIMVLPLQ